MRKRKLGIALALAAPLAFMTADAFQAGVDPLKKSDATATTQAKPPPAPSKRLSTRVDAMGDPLPDGAIARLGARRFRHDGECSTVAFTPDGKWVLAQTNSGLTVWDTVTGIERYVLPPLRALNSSFGRELAVAPDGTTFATRASAAIKDPDNDHVNVITLWELATGKPVRTFAMPKGPQHSQILRMQYSPDGKHLAVVQVSGQIVVFDVVSGKQRPITSGLEKDLYPHNIAISPDSKLLAVAMSNAAPMAPFHRTVRLWELATGRFLRIVHDFLIPDGNDESYGNVVAAMAFSRDGKTLALATEGEITLHDPATGKKTGRIAAKARTADLAFTPDNRYLLSADATDSKLRMWELASGKETLVKGDGDYLCQSMALSPDGKTAVLGTTGNTLRIWDLPSGTERFTQYQSHDDPISHITFSPDGKTLVSAASDKYILWDTATRRQTGTLPGYGWPLSFSPDGSQLVAIGWANEVLFWNWSENKKPSTLVASGNVESAHLSVDGRKLFTLDARHDDKKSRYCVVHWDAATHKQEQSWDLPEGLSPALLAGDGRTVFVWTNRMEFGVCDAPSGRHRALPSGNKARSMSLSPDLHNVALGAMAANDTVRVTEIVTGQDIFVRKGHQGSIAALAWSTDGRFLASGDDDNGLRTGFAPSIRLWDTADGRELACFNNLGSSVSALTFAPDDKTLIAGFRDGTMLVFDVATFDPRPAAASNDLKEDWAFLWADLAADAAKAQRANWKFVDGAKQSLPFLRSRLKPIPVADETRMQKLIADLDSGTFTVREAATKQFKALGEQVEPGMRAALKGDLPLETRRRLNQFLENPTSPETLQSIRAIAALERIGNADAAGVLESLSKGAAGSRTTEEAAAALARVRANSAAAMRTP